MKGQDSKTKFTGLGELDITELRSLMDKGQSFCMEGLNSWIESTVERMEKNRQVLSVLEEDLLDPEKLDKLAFREWMALRKLLDKNMRNDMQFLKKLLHSSPQTKENFELLETLVKERKKRQGKKSLSEIVNGILQQIKEKVAREQGEMNKQEGPTSLSVKNL